MPLTSAALFCLLATCSFSDLLREFPSVFAHESEKKVSLSSKLTDFDERTKAVAGSARLRHRRRFPAFPQITLVPAHHPRQPPQRLTYSLRPPVSSAPARADCMQKLKDKGKIPGWRDELFPVTEGLDAEPFFLIERAAVSWFGLKARPMLCGAVSADAFLCHLVCVPWGDPQQV